MNNKHRIILVIIILGIVIGINIQVYINIQEYFEDSPTTLVWYNFAYMEIITQIGISLIMYLVKKCYSLEK